MTSHNHNFNDNVQHVSVSSCGKLRSDSCFHNRANGVKSSKIVGDLSVCEDVTSDFCSNITSEPMKSVLSRKSFHKSVSNRHLSRTSISNRNSSVKSNVSFSVCRTSACFDQSSPVFNIQKYCNLFFSGCFDIRIPLQNVSTQEIFFYIFTFFFSFFYVL